MGHDAFVGSYRKPNIKLHIIIFLTIVGVSVFLSTQVEKTKNNTRVEALKTPVSIDSVFVEENAQQANELTLTESTSSSIIREVETEYRFEGGSNLEAIDSLLAKAEGFTDSLTTDSTNLSKDETKPESNLELDNLAIKSNESEREKDVAIMVTDDVVSASDAPKEKPKKIGKLDAVYELQQDRFLETLAKTAILETEETVEVKRMKEAMRSDRPLTIKSAVKADSAAEIATDDPTLVKVASTQTPQIVEAQVSAKDNNSAKSKQKTVVAKKSTAVRNGAIANNTSELDNIALTKSELNNVLLQFTRSYNQGDLNRLMALFHDNAITNDQKNKYGIKAEYSDLFKSTSERTIKIDEIQWDLGKGAAKGDAKFTVVVKPVGSAEAARIDGKIEIVAIKESRGVFIKSLLHEVSTQ